MYIRRPGEQWEPINVSGDFYDAAYEAASRLYLARSYATVKVDLEPYAWLDVRKDHDVTFPFRFDAYVRDRKESEYIGSVEVLAPEIAKMLLRIAKECEEYAKKEEGQS